MNGRSDAIGNRASGRWSKSCSAMPGLWTMTIACGVAPWISPSVTLLYAGWSSDPWPSTSTQSPRDSPSSTSHSTVPWRKSAATRSTVTPQPSTIIPVWPVATNTADRPAAWAARRSSNPTDILPIAQSVPTVSTTRLPGQVAAADGGVHALGRPPVVDQPHARRPRRLRELRVVAEERVQPAEHVEAGTDRGQDRPAARRRGACRRWARCRSGARSPGAGTRARRSGWRRSGCRSGPNPRATRGRFVPPGWSR